MGWGWGCIRGIWRWACIQDLNCVAYFFLAGAYIRELINGILRYFKQLFLGTFLHGFFWLHTRSDMGWNWEGFFLTVHLISLPINLQSEYTTINVCIQKEILRWSILWDVFQMLAWARFWRGVCNLEVAQPKFKIPRIFLILVENDLFSFTPKWWEILRGDLL